MDLFSEQQLSDTAGQQILLDGGDLTLFAQAFASDEADHYFTTLHEQLQWTQEKIAMYGKTHNVPRLSAWYGDNNIPYTYSNITAYGLPWTPALAEIKTRVEQLAAAQFNSVLANLYRDGGDGVSWHADDERELGSQPVIASVSFGFEREFQFKHKRNKNQRAKLLLPHGSVLVMRGDTQRNWLHQIAKSKRAMEARINLTFRNVDAALAQAAIKSAH